LARRIGSKMDKTSNKYCTLCIYLVLILTTLAVFWQLHNYDFVHYDDDTYVTDNRHIHSGLSWQGIRWAFTSGYASNWHPLVWLSHMLDCQLFGLRAGAHHLTSVLFHIVNTLLLFAILKRMTGALWASAFVAAVFGLHPLHVESVAWVAERKDVLSTFFWMLTMWAYVRYAEHPKLSRYSLTVVFFVLGLLAKPMLVTLPFVLLLLDYWPLERMQLGKCVGSGDLQNHNVPNAVEEKPILYLVIEKAPFFVFSVISSIVTFFVQRIGGAVPTMEAMGVGARISNAIVSYVGYIVKMIWPSRLAVLYPHPGSSLSTVRVAICGLLLVLISVCFIYLAHRRRYLAVGWLWYVGTLVPVIGLVQIGAQAMADRYTYIPLTGLFIIIAWGLPDLVAKWRYRRVVLAASAIAVLSAAVVCTSLQLKYWQSNVALFRHALDVTRNNWLMHNNYANVLVEMGQIDEAIDHFYESLRIKPNHAKIHNNLGNALSRIGKIDDAIEHYNKALKLKLNFPEAHYNLGLELAKQGKLDEAISEFREALRLGPEDADTLSNLGFAFAQQGNFDEAIEYYHKAIELEPNSVVTCGRWGLALSSQGKIDEAIEKFRIVLRQWPEDAEMHCNVGILLERQGKTNQAIQHYLLAVQSDPNHFGAHKNLGIALTSQGRLDEAIPHFRKVLQHRPGDANVHYNLAVILMGKGLIDEAISEFREALRINPNHKQARRGLEAALAEQENP